MTATPDLLALALALADTGCSVIPVGPDKRPWIAWKPYQEKRADHAQIQKWASNPKTTGFALVCGAISGGAEVLDFDEPDFYPAWINAAPDWAVDLPSQKTGGGGWQVAYRRPLPPGNTKLAWVPREADENGEVIAAGRVVAIETRGTGGYVLIPHSLHPSGNTYEPAHGSWAELPTLTEEQAQQLHEAARSTCQAPLSRQELTRLQQAHETRSKAHRAPADGESVVDAYNGKYDIHEALRAAGYTPFTKTRYTRPGADASPGGVHLLEDKRGRLCSYHHSSNDLLNDGHLHDPFDLFVAYQHGGDFKAAVKAAARELGVKHTPPATPGITVGSTRTKGSEGTPAPALNPQPISEPPPSPIYIAHGGYTIDRPVKKNGEIVDWTPEQLTNWTWTPTLRLQYPDGAVGERGALIVNGRHRGEVQIEARAWASRKDLLEVIAGYQAVCYTTNNTDIAKIYQGISLAGDDLPTARGVRSYGLHLVDGEWLELFEDRTISTHDLPPVFYAGTPIDPGSRSHRAPRDATPEQVDAARRAIIKLPSLVTPATARAVLGYAVAAVFAPRITPALGNRLPFLFNAGERESGKTSAAQIALELTTGYSARITKAGGMTPYQYDIAHSGANNLLSILDEYRPGEIDDAQLRKHHDLGVKWRGSGVASKDHAYELNAPTIIAGEGFTDDAATKSRGVLYFTRKKDRGSVEAYSEINRLPLWAYAGHLHTLARDTSEEEHQARLRRAEQLAQQAAGGTSNPRLQYALTFIAYGLLVLQDDVEPSAFTDQLILDTLADGVFNTLEGGSEGITNLEMFLQQLSFCLTKVSNPRQYVAPSSTSGQLIIRPQVCVDLVQAQYRERAAIANVTLFKQYAEQAVYFEQGDVHKTPEGKTVRGKRIALALIPARCEADLLREFEEAMRE
ncbi:bifunctional DNA primase/polymerase [Deinococcus actinosclerus]|uniref:DNA primase/polymerase bifunctional N-terminal domain-containing protein n=1 Tax=Deinococcus actinosclerus TaxID=1768108 RepID=A0ABN4K951_9DEIO|nr:bifunctional DNA primase/polymerase [Deinococcus actinosclerus]ALW89636.1 hypothetical protein AUC44_12610 [Deinococcus actinosclerus]